MNDRSNLSYAFSRVADNEKNVAVISLDGAWQFKSTDEDVWMDAAVPGTVHSDLIRAGRLEDPYYRDNEFKVQWVEKKDWEYRKEFWVDSSFLESDVILLKCYGLDTIAEIYINDRPVADTCNMFIEYEFDVKPFLKTGENHIHIVFKSILEWLQKKIQEEPRVIWEDEKSNYFFSRKSGTDFGWDWGIRLLTCGIWRPICLAAYNTARITSLYAESELDEVENPKKATLNITAEISRFKEESLDLDINVSLDGREICTKKVPVSGEKVDVCLTIDNPELWWPNGWGKQPLYTVTARLNSQDSHVSTREIRIGIRSVQLVQEKDERGLSFGLKVNGHRIFCKGGNWIPAGALRGELTEGHYKDLLYSCKEANFNMIRLWGGGIYEAEYFYDFCDEYGIMIWQDFMFAVGPYLDNKEYLQNVSDEISNVVCRLRHHPSIILWCGNNEQECGMPKWMEDYETVTWEGYDSVFNGVIPEVVKKYDSGRPYVPSSPHHPLHRDKNRGIFRTASGDAHIWDVWHHEEPFSWYLKNLDFRFVSEYGFQSLPHMETIVSFTRPEDRYFPSRIMDLHNKGGKKSLLTEDSANKRIAMYMAEVFGLPNNFENIVYISQLLQGEAMKIASEAYRRNFPSTTGALYWQINDNWPTISWSSLDYYGRWKAMHYMACHFFNPILACALVEDTRVKIWGVNDYLHETDAYLEWTLARFDGSTVKEGRTKASLPANSSTLITELDFSCEAGENPEHITYRNTNYENRSRYYITYRLVQGNRLLSSNVAFFAPQKYLALEEPIINYEVKKTGNKIIIRLEAQRFAAYVKLGFGEKYARFSDNYFHLVPGEIKEVELIEGYIPDEDIEKELQVKSLVDCYL